MGSIDLGLTSFDYPKGIPKKSEVIIDITDRVKNIQDKEELFRNDFFELVVDYSKGGYNTTRNEKLEEIKKACDMVSIILYEIDREVDYYLSIFSKDINSLDLGKQFIKIFIYILLEIVSTEEGLENNNKDELLYINLKDIIGLLAEIDTNFLFLSKYIDLIISRISTLYNEGILKINLGRYN